MKKINNGNQRHLLDHTSGRSKNIVEIETIEIIMIRIKIEKKIEEVQ